MEKIEITFLGTSDSIPTKNRNHTAILLSYKNENILIDCGEGTQRQFKKAELNPCKLTSILITHWHGDHILGLPGLLQTMFMQGYAKKLNIYGPKGTAHYFSLLRSLYNLQIPLNIIEIENKKFLETPDFYIETKSMQHTAKTNAYSFKIKDKIRLNKNKLAKYKLPNSPLLKKLQEGKDIIYKNKKIKSSQVSYVEKGRKITFIFDTAYNKNAVEIAKNSDLLISECTFSEKEKLQAKEKKHLTSKDAALIAKKAKAKSLILTHISQRYESSLKEIEKEAKKYFKNSSVAHDLQTLII